MSVRAIFTNIKLRRQYRRYRTLGRYLAIAKIALPTYELLCDCISYTLKLTVFCVIILPPLIAQKYPPLCRRPLGMTQGVERFNHQFPTLQAQGSRSKLQGPRLELGGSSRSLVIISKGGGVTRVSSKIHCGAPPPGDLKSIKISLKINLIF